MDGNNNNNNRGQNNNFIPRSNNMRASYPPQTLRQPIIVPNTWQYPQNSGFFGLQSIYYGQQQQQQQYQYMQMPNQPVLQQQFAPQVPLIPLVPTNNTIPYWQQQPQYPANMMPESHSMQSQTQQQFNQGAQQYFTQEARRRAHFKKIQVQPEFIEQNRSSSLPSKFENAGTNGRDSSDLQLIPNRQQNAYEDSQPEVKQEERQITNEKEKKETARNRQSQDNNTPDLGSDPHKKIKIEDEQQDMQNNQQNKGLDITQMGLTNQGSQQQDSHQNEMKMEEPIEQKCKIETTDKEDDLEQDKEESDDEEEYFVCKQNDNFPQEDQEELLITYEDVEENRKAWLEDQDYQNIHSANQEKTSLQYVKQQEGDVPLNEEKTSENLMNQDQINQSKTTIETKDSQNNLVDWEQKDAKPKSKSTINNKQNSPKNQATHKSNISYEQRNANGQQKFQEMKAFIDSLSKDQKKFVKKFLEIKPQNCFKNVMKGFMNTVTEKFEKIYTYYNPSGYVLKGNILKTLNVIVIADPSQEQLSTFKIKFNKFLLEKKLNNLSIERVVKSNLYSKVLTDFLNNYSAEWLESSVLTQKDDTRLFLEFLRLSIIDPNYVFLLHLRPQALNLLKKE